MFYSRFALSLHQSEDNMLIILLILICLALGIACLIYMYRHSSKEDNERQDVAQGETSKSLEQCDTTCGDASCTLDCLPKMPKDHPVYFDDEELDQFKGRASSDYSESEVEQFSEVLYTMKEEEVPEWLSSLQQREVELPDELKDEIYIILQEIRKHEQTKR